MKEDFLEISEQEEQEIVEKLLSLDTHRALGEEILKMRKTMAPDQVERIFSKVFKPTTPEEIEKMKNHFQELKKKQDQKNYDDAMFWEQEKDKPIWHP